MSATVIIIIFMSGLLGGMVNAIAGGGTFLTFGALTLVGVPPIMATTTSALTQFPGYLTSVLAYRSEIRACWRDGLALAAVSAIGAILGAFLLLTMENQAFSALVPWLLLAATGLFAAGPWLKLTPRQDGNRSGSRLPGLVAQFITGIYGGFFAAGMGVMMLATLGLTEKGDYHRLNALKNLLSIVIAAIAIVIFVAGGAIAWGHAIVMLPAVALGGYLGVWLAKRLSQTLVRIAVVLIGLLLSAYYFTIG